MRRILAPGGVFAAWSYGVLDVEDAAVTALVHRFHDEIVGPFWPPERRLVVSGYRTLAFPFAEIVTPPVAMEVDWTVDQMLSYLGTWSATEAYRSATSLNPIAEIEPELRRVWPGAPRRVRWPLVLRAGRCEPRA